MYRLLSIISLFFLAQVAYAGHHESGHMKQGAVIGHVAHAYGHGLWPRSTRCFVHRGLLAPSWCRLVRAEQDVIARFAVLARQRSSFDSFTDPSAICRH